MPKISGAEGQSRTDKGSPTGFWVWCHRARTPPIQADCH